MLVSSGQISLGGSIVGRSLNREFGASDTASVSMDDTLTTRRLPVSTLNTAGTTLSFSDFHSRVYFRPTTSGPSGTHFYVAASGNGSIIYTNKFESTNSTNYLYKSTNYGLTYSLIYTIGTGSISSIACSSDGSIVVYTVNNVGAYVSTNGGSSFTLRLSVNLPLLYVTCSSSGALMLIHSYSTSVASQLYVSTNSGTNWTARGSSFTYWYASYCSGNSTYMYALNTNATNGYIWRSSDSGTTWSKINTTAYARTIGCSDNGQIVWTSSSNVFYVSTDYGVSFSSKTASAVPYYRCFCSSDGARVMNYSGSFTTDTGSTWYTAPSGVGGATNTYSAFSRDGTKAYCSITYSSAGNQTVGVGYMTNV